MDLVIRMESSVAAALIAHARSQPKLECCGLLAGRRGLLEEILPARNLLNSPTAYEIAPLELFSLIRDIRARGLDLTGIYHSHPTTDNSPSPTDIERAYYSGVPYVILSPMENAPHPIRGFFIENGSVSEPEIILI